MELFPKTVRHLLPKNIDNVKCKDLIAPVKFFSIYSGWTWFACSAEPWGKDDVLFSGFVIGIESEFGDFSLSELQQHGAERDLSFDPIYLSPLMANGTYVKVAKAG